MPKIIAIEGLPGAGKTSFLMDALFYLPKQYNILPELNPTPKSDWHSASDEEKGKIFNALWFQRIKILKSLGNENLLHDRSFFSNLAFAYAFDAIFKPGYYKEQLETFKTQVTMNEFDLIICLDISAELSIKRRLDAKIPMPSPWDNTNFLNKFREFYLKQLPLLTNSKIIYISAEISSLNQISDEIFKQIGIKKEKKIVSAELPKSMIEFSEINLLGRPLSSVFNTLGHPTAYFRQQALQLIDDKVKFLDNATL